MLTVYIPTFNRATRLSENLKLVIDQIVVYELQSKVSILVGDNASEDNTQSICAVNAEFAKAKQIKFSYFRNPRNLGFNGNIQAGYLQVNSGWIMFLSDDDVLCAGALNQICMDLSSVSPDTALYNFDQAPFDRQNPLNTKTLRYKGNQDFSKLASLFTWQKLTGVVLRCRQPGESDEFFQHLLSPARHYPHIVLSVLRYHTGNVLYKSRFFVAKPDLDHLEHINFPWYTSESLIMELTNCRSILNLNNSSFNEQLSNLPRVNVIDSSVTHLLLYYTGHARITASLRSILWNNLFRFLTFQRSSQDGFALKCHSLKFYVKLMLLVFVFPASFIILPIFGKKRKLMHEGF